MKYLVGGIFALISALILLLIGVDEFFSGWLCCMVYSISVELFTIKRIFK